MKKVVWPILILLLTGCSNLRHVNRSTPMLSHKEARTLWGKILKTYVNDKGFVDFKKLKNQPEDLRAYIAYAQKNGPWSCPSEFKERSARMAYHLNTYNAFSMFNVIESGLPSTNAGLKKVKFFFLTKFIIDGRKMSLHAYENEVIRKLGDPRIHFSLNCMSYGCPKLLNVPYTSENLEQELENGARLFFNEQRNVRVEEADKTVYLSEILSFYTEDFVVEFPSLISYTNLYRQTPIPESFEVKFIPYDWRILHAE